MDVYFFFSRGALCRGILQKRGRNKNGQDTKKEGPPYECYECQDEERHYDVGHRDGINHGLDHSGQENLGPRSILARGNDFAGPHGRRGHERGPHYSALNALLNHILITRVSTREILSLSQEKGGYWMTLAQLDAWVSILSGYRASRFVRFSNRLRPFYPKSFFTVWPKCRPPPANGQPRRYGSASIRTWLETMAAAWG